MDDILIYNCNIQEHQGHLRTILELIENNNLYLNLIKSKFATKEVNFLGHIIGGLGRFKWMTPR